MNTVERFYFLLKNKDIYSPCEYNNLLKDLLKEHQETIIKDTFDKHKLLN